MSIIRAPRKTGNFYILDKAISEDRRLTWAARGLLIYLLGKTDHWEVSITNLRNETKQSRRPTERDGVYALIDELIQAGYVTRTQERLASGKLGEVDYLVSEISTESPLPSQPDTVGPYPAKTTQVRTDKKGVLKKGRKEGKPANFQAPEQQEGQNGLGGPPNSQQPPAPAPEPAAAQVPSPPPPPPSFDDEQPQQPPAPAPVAAQVPKAAPAPVAAQVPKAAPEPAAAQVPKAAPAPVAAQVPKAAPEPAAAQVPDLSPSVIDAINAQRLTNNKTAWTAADLASLRTQAAAAGITADEAARWILERPTRNFFQASYYKAVTPPAPAPAGPARPRINPPAPLPATTPEQAAEGERIQKEMQERMKEKRAAAVPVPPTEQLSGPEWAINVVKGIRKGQLIGIRSIKMAAEVLGISHIALQTEMLQLTKR